MSAETHERYDIQRHVLTGGGAGEERNIEMNNNASTSTEPAQRAYSSSSSRADLSCQVVEARGDLRVLEAVNLLRHLQSPPAQRLGLVIPPAEHAGCAIIDAAHV